MYAQTYMQVHAQLLHCELISDQTDQFKFVFSMLVQQSHSLARLNSSYVLYASQVLISYQLLLI